MTPKIYVLHEVTHAGEEDTVEYPYQITYDTVSWEGKNLIIEGHNPDSNLHTILVDNERDEDGNNLGDYTEISVFLIIDGRGYNVLYKKEFYVPFSCPFTANNETRIDANTTIQDVMSEKIVLEQATLRRNDYILGIDTGQQELNDIEVKFL